ncbi:unnamed protein product, partial [Scytosiphon promiscuus]
MAIGSGGGGGGGGGGKDYASMASMSTPGGGGGGGGGGKAFPVRNPGSVPGRGRFVTPPPSVHANGAIARAMPLAGKDYASLASGLAPAAAAARGTGIGGGGGSGIDRRGSGGGGGGGGASYADQARDVRNAGRALGAAISGRRSDSVAKGNG